MPKPRRTVGRPTLYSPEIADRFLGCIFEGMTVAAALKQDGMPVKQTILNWTKAHPEFRRAYDEAISIRNYCWMDECVDIADGPQLANAGSRETRIAARWKQITAAANGALGRCGNHSNPKAQDRQHLIETDPVYAKLYEWELEARRTTEKDGPVAP